jgi:hypothetical protein
MVIAIEAALRALLQDLDVAVAERDFAVARNTLDVGGHVLSVLDRDADILSVEVRAAGRCQRCAYGVDERGMCAFVTAGAIVRLHLYGGERSAEAVWGKLCCCTLQQRQFCQDHGTQSQIQPGHAPPSTAPTPQQHHKLTYLTHQHQHQHQHCPLPPPHTHTHRCRTLPAGATTSRPSSARAAPSWPPYWSTSWGRRRAARQRCAARRARWRSSRRPATRRL